MESINLFRGGSSEADSHPVSGRCFTVARTGNDKCRLFAAIEYPAVAKRAEVIDTKRAQDDIVKCGGFLDIGCANEHMRKDAVTRNYRSCHFPLPSV